MKSEKIRNKSTDKNNPRQSCDGVTNCTSFQLLTIVKNLTIRLFVPFPKKCWHFLGALLNASCVWSQKRKNKRKGDTFQTCFENEQKRNFFFGAGDGSRTHMVLLPQAPETCASAISPLPHYSFQFILFLFYLCASFSKLVRLPLPPQKYEIFGDPSSATPALLFLILLILYLH